MIDPILDISSKQWSISNLSSLKRTLQVYLIYILYPLSSSWILFYDILLFLFLYYYYYYYYSYLLLYYYYPPESPRGGEQSNGNRPTTPSGGILSGHRTLRGALPNSPTNNGEGNNNNNNTNNTDDNNNNNNNNNNENGGMKGLEQSFLQTINSDKLELTKSELIISEKHLIKMIGRATNPDFYGKRYINISSTYLSKSISISIYLSIYYPSLHSSIYLSILVESPFG